MKRVSVLMEVDDRTYELVVDPYKKNKIFAKLMAGLLEGFISDDYIRAYAEGVTNDMRKASVSSIDSALEGMEDSLTNLGLLSNDLKETSNQGMNYFEGKSEGRSVDKPDISKDFTDRVEVIEKQNAEILEMLQTLLSTGVQFKAEKEIKVVEEVSSIEETTEDVVDLNKEFDLTSSSVSEELPPVDDNEPFVPTISLEDIGPIKKPTIKVMDASDVNEDDIPEEPKKNAKDILDGFVAGNKYTY